MLRCVSVGGVCFFVLFCFVLFCFYYFLFFFSFYFFWGGREGKPNAKKTENKNFCKSNSLLLLFIISFFFFSPILQPSKKEKCSPLEKPKKIDIFYFFLFRKGTTKTKKMALLAIVGGVFIGLPVGVYTTYTLHMSAARTTTKLRFLIKHQHLTTRKPKPTPKPSPKPTPTPTFSPYPLLFSSSLFSFLPPSSLFSLSLLFSPSLFSFLPSSSPFF